MLVNKVEVSGDIGEFTTGQILVDRAEIAKYYRQSLLEGADDVDAVAQLSDDNILKIVDATDISECTDGDILSDIDVLRTDALEKHIKQVAAA